MSNQSNHLFYICDLRKEFSGNPYVTFWRPSNANYAYPLEWSGKYALEELEPGYHETYVGRVAERFPVECSLVEAMAVMSSSGFIDGGSARVVENSVENRRILRRSRLRMGVTGGVL